MLGVKQLQTSSFLFLSSSLCFPLFGIHHHLRHDFFFERILYKTSNEVLSKDLHDKNWKAPVLSLNLFWRSLSLSESVCLLSACLHHQNHWEPVTWALVETKRAQQMILTAVIFYLCKACDIRYAILCTQSSSWSSFVPWYRSCWMKKTKNPKGWTQRM